MNAGLFYSPCGSELYLPREMKVEPDLSLVRDESSVRYFSHILVIAKSIYHYPCCVKKRYRKKAVVLH